MASAEYNAAWKAANPEKLAAQRARRLARTRALIDRAKDKPCERCGGEFPPCVMDLHHSDPETKVGHVAHLRYSVTKLLAEIDKCQVLCANCHRIIEYEQGDDA